MNVEIGKSNSYIKLSIFSDVLQCIYQYINNTNIKMSSLKVVIIYMATSTINSSFAGVFFSAYSNKVDLNNVYYVYSTNNNSYITHVCRMFDL